MKIGKYKTNQLYIGDSKELSKTIPDNSIDLIFTDPVYQNIEDYAWLAETASRILKPGGNLLVYAGHAYQILCINAMSPYLDARPILITWMSPPYGRLWAYKLHINYLFLLWFTKHGTPTKWIVGEIGQAYQRKNFNHKWGKNFFAIKYYITHFTEEHDIVFDPFTGGATIPMACKDLRRNYLAFELDKNIAKQAKRMIKERTEPLPLIFKPDKQGNLFENSKHENLLT